MTDEMLASQFKFSSFEMDLWDSINYDKEAMLENLVEQTGLSPEEFGVYFILEEHPVEVITAGSPELGDYSIKVTQEFKVRPRRPDEMQIELETGEKDG